MCGAIPPLPNTLSWCGAQLKAQGQHYLYLYLYLASVTAGIAAPSVVMFASWFYIRVTCGVAMWVAYPSSVTDV
jgi:hypothetical protein